MSKNSVTRRAFLATSTTSAAGLVGCMTAGAAAKKFSATDTIKIGLIGCGGRGGGAVQNCLQGNDNVKLVAMADAFEDKVKAKLAQFKSNEDPKIKPKIAVDDDMCFWGLDAYKKLLATDIDMVIHATPPYARPMHIEAIINAGKHLFTEKPIAVDPAGIRQAIAAFTKAKEMGLSVVTGTQRRHQNPYVETVKKIRDGAIGEITSARAYWCGGLPFAHARKPEWSDLEFRLRNWYNYVWVCGDNIVEQHVHNLDIINWIMGGPPAKVFASGGRTWKSFEKDYQKYGDIWDQYSCDYEYANGVHMTSLCRHWNNSDGGVFEQVTGTKGVSNCHDMGKEIENPYVQEHIDLLASIRNTGPYLNEGVRCAESTMTAIMGRMSAFTGKALTWEEALNADLSIVPADLSFDNEYPLGPVAVPGMDNVKALEYQQWVRDAVS